MKSELESIAEKIPHQQDKSRCISPQDRHIGQKQKPSDKESVITAEYFRNESVCSARNLRGREHLMIIVCQNDNDCRSDQKSDDRSRGSRIRQKHFAGKNERPPADRIAE